MPPAPTVTPGEIVAGKYRVEAVIGAGGMGVVVAAWHLRLARRVALKFMRADHDAPEAATRFLREAQATSQLHSEHVVRILDAAELDDGTPYIVMEHLAGGDVAALVARHGALEPALAAAVVAQACGGMAEAHAAGIVHRDLKPQNLVAVARDDGPPVIKIVDFGVSKLARAAVAGHDTGTGVTMGSPQYMAPEQMRSTRDADARADVWSLGAILYELCAGVPPFAAPSVPEIYAKVLGEAPRPLADVAEDVPAALAAVVHRCLDKRPEHRYDDASVLGEALRPLAAVDLGALRADVAALAADAEARRDRAIAATVAAGAAAGVGAGTALASTVASSPSASRVESPPAPRAGRGVAIVAGLGVVAAIAVATVVVVRRGGTSSSTTSTAANVPAATGDDVSPYPAAPVEAGIDRRTGERRLEEHDPEAAIASFVRCWELTSDPACLRGWGVALLAQGDRAEAAMRLEWALALDPFGPDRDDTIAAIDQALGPREHGTLPAPGPAALARAQVYFDRGTAAYSAGRYNDAVREYLRAWAEGQYPPFLYNLGRCAEKAGDLRRAIHFYERYQVWDPSPAVHDEVAAEIARVRARLAGDR